jgi:AcrR family transcriptional regulator
MNLPASRRPYHSQVRDAQKVETRLRILEALVAQLLQGTFDSISMKEIAQAAGVGLATLYRYFPNREALLDAIADEYFLRQLGDLPYPQTPDDIATGMHKSFIAFDADAKFVELYFTTELGRTARRRGRARRVVAIQAALRPVTAGMDENRRRGAEGVIAYLASIQAWLTMREELGIDGVLAGESIAWAIQTLVDDLRRKQDGRVRTDLPEKENDNGHGD